MQSIKVNPDEMLSNIKKIDSNIANYEKHCKELLDILKSNEAQLDEATQNSLVNSVNDISQKFGSMAKILKQRSILMKTVVESYKSVNEGNGQAAIAGVISGITIPTLDIPN